MRPLSFYARELLTLTVLAGCVLAVAKWTGFI